LNTHLEILSDKVRKGEPIGFLEAIAVIEYQERLNQEQKNNSFVSKIKRLFRIGADRPSKGTS
jgi:hypothetical protein